MIKEFWTKWQLKPKNVNIQKLQILYNFILTLDCEDKVDWRSCQLNQTEEIECTQAFRKRFQPFDFTLEDDD